MQPLTKCVDSDVSGSGDEDEDLWSNMEVVQATKLKRKSKAQSVREMREARLEESSPTTKKSKLDKSTQDVSSFSKKKFK